MNFSSSALFHMKTRVCLKELVNDCRGANLAGITKIATMFIKTTFKDSNELKRNLYLYFLI